MSEAGYYRVQHRDLQIQTVLQKIIWLLEWTNWVFLCRIWLIMIRVVQGQDLFVLKLYQSLSRLDDEKFCRLRLQDHQFAVALSSSLDKLVAHLHMIAPHI